MRWKVDFGRFGGDVVLALAKSWCVESLSLESHMEEKPWRFS